MVKYGFSGAREFKDNCRVLVRLKSFFSSFFWGGGGGLEKNTNECLPSISELIRVIGNWIMRHSNRISAIEYKSEN